MVAGSRSKLSMLWLVAAVLAIAAGIVDYVRHGEINVAALTIAAMAIVMFIVGTNKRSVDDSTKQDPP